MILNREYGYAQACSLRCDNFRVSCLSHCHVLLACNVQGTCLASVTGGHAQNNIDLR